MRSIILLLAVIIPVVASADQVVKKVDWADLKAKGSIVNGEVKTEDKTQAIYIELVNTSAVPGTFTLLEIKTPEITSPAYRIDGKVKYNIQGNGYLEMWNYFPGGGAYFTRTLGNAGAMASLKGASDWREFSVPFMVRDNTGWLTNRPERLVFNVYLPPHGTIQIGNMELIQMPEVMADAFGGKVGMCAAIVFGLLGAIIGTLAGMGKARRFVVLLIYGGLFGGAILFIWGIIAVLKHQPYSVYYPLLLVGFLSLVILGSLLPIINKKYLVLEMRKIKAMDA